jgi:microcystin-dependent protein
VGTPFISEIRIMGFGFAPRLWAQCNGQVLPIPQNTALFSLIGNAFGGDGIRNFALPNLQGRTPIHQSSGYPIGLAGGEQAHVLTVGEGPVHTHAATGTVTGGDSPVGAGNYLGAADNMYGALASATGMSPTTISNAGGSQPHNNMQPYQVLNFCIALSGAYPSS